MALFFNLEVLEKESGSDDHKFLVLLRYHFKGTILVHKTTKYKPLKSLKGNSFLLNPIPVLYSRDHDVSNRVQYIKLAGRRDLLLYKNYGIKYLDRSYFPDLDIEKISKNPLLTITNKQINFKFEEEYGTKV